MGAKASKPSNSERDQAKSFSSTQRSSSIIESMKPECLKKRKKKKKKKQTKVRTLTLEDWLLASPGPKGLNPDYLNGGELHVFKHLSRRVHHHHRSGPFTTGDNNLCLEQGSGEDVSGSSFRRSHNGKLKKKVSFKLREEGDIVLFYSAAESFESDYRSF
ncbi:hypothetical protein Goshw_026507 [Gossypium schwendimanii]|uniref:Uncharacterized protein n=2 Tax=Gossypium TaxID=3633 RepID=A0A7J9MDX0_GOSSC|nr:hypothetical protein [Gossypium lobatum]MBA0869305.1 hypothetical protein [Gossypium schwendimanii]